MAAYRESPGSFFGEPCVLRSADGEQELVLYVREMDYRASIDAVGEITIRAFVGNEPGLRSTSGQQPAVEKFLRAIALGGGPLG